MAIIFRNGIIWERQMRKLNQVLLDTWTSAAGVQERDYLRALHEKTNLQALARELNKFSISRGIALKMSSLWVDWQPQSWKWIHSKNAFGKPSVELADLVVVVWDDDSQVSGTALVLAAKMGGQPNTFALSGKSTKKEITLLESPYRFMLSNNLSGVPKPLPGYKQPECEFDFSSTGGFDYWRWLIIRKHKSFAWHSKTLRYTVKTSTAAKIAPSFSRELINMVMGKAAGRFYTNCMSCEWCRFINLLLGHTATISHHPKALGPARVDSFVSRFAASNNPSAPSNCSYLSLGLAACLPKESMGSPEGIMAILTGDGNGEASGIFDRSENLPHPQCSILFITKSEIPPYVRTEAIHERPILNK